MSQKARATCNTHRIHVVYLPTFGWFSWGICMWIYHCAMNPSWENPARPCLFTLKAIEVEPFRRHGMHASDFFANTTREVDRELKGNGDISNIQGLRRFVLVHFFSWLCSLLYLAVYRSHNVEPWITSNITSKCNCSPSISPTLYIQTPIEEVFEPPNISWGSASFASPQTSIIYLDLQKHTLFCAFEFVLVIMKSVRLIMFCSSRIVANKGACRHFWNVRSFAQMCAFVRKCALAVRPGFA